MTETTLHGCHQYVCNPSYSNETVAMPEALPHCPGGDMHVTSEWRAVAG